MGLALSCHDLSEGGLAVAAAEMAFAGGIGAEIHVDRVPRSGCERDEAILFSETNTRYLLEVRLDLLPAVFSLLDGLPAAVVGETVKYRILRVMGRDSKPVIAEALGDLKASWKRPLCFG